MKTFTLLNETIDSLEVSRFLPQIIDLVSNSYKLKYLTEWERDHSTLPYSEEIENLENVKDEVVKTLRSIKEGKVTIEIKIEE